MISFENDLLFYWNKAYITGSKSQKEEQEIIDVGFDARI
ncbi:MAG: hypothetical protein ACI86L_002080 [Dokdonia sp.]|jgi:hypothetical protein